MAESMKGLKRSHRCTEVSSENIGETVTLMGWVQKRRNLGSLIFVDLRDRSGLIQLYFEEETIGEEGFKKAGSLRSIHSKISRKYIFLSFIIFYFKITFAVNTHTYPRIYC